MTKKRTEFWVGPRYSPLKNKKGVSLVVGNANELILEVVNEQGFAVLVLEPKRDLATLIEAVQVLMAQVVSQQNRAVVRDLLEGAPQKRRQGAKKKSR